MWLLEIEPLSTVVEPCGQLCKGHENCTKFIKLVTTAKHKDNMFGLFVCLSDQSMTMGKMNRLSVNSVGQSHGCVLP